jgi:lipopolysaccharide transport system permease protein
MLPNTLTKYLAKSLGVRAYQTNAYRNVDLIFRLVAREFAMKYRGNVLGAVWAFLTPLLTAVIYAFVFTKVLKARWQVLGQEEPNFTLVLLTGIIIHTIFAESISRAPGLIVANASYVKKVVFPLEILPVVVVLNAVITAGIGMIVVFICNMIVSSTLSLWAPLAVAVILPYAIFVLGAVYLLAAIGAYLRDIGQLVTFVVTASLFLSPIFYPLSAVPEPFRTAMRFNPITTAVEEGRNMLIFGEAPAFMPILMLFAFSLVFLTFSIWIFRRLRPGFADVV